MRSSTLASSRHATGCGIEPSRGQSYAARPALYSQADVYPSRRRFVWFLTTVPDHCAAKQVFSIPPFGVERIDMVD